VNAARFSPACALILATLPTVTSPSPDVAFRNFIPPFLLSGSKNFLFSTLPTGEGNVQVVPAFGEFRAAVASIGRELAPIHKFATVGFFLPERLSLRFTLRLTLLFELICTRLSLGNEFSTTLSITFFRGGHCISRQCSDCLARDANQRGQWDAILTCRLIQVSVRPSAFVRHLVILPPMRWRGDCKNRVKLQSDFPRLGLLNNTAIGSTEELQREVMNHSYTRPRLRKLH
jgi:hypothetical protein